MSAKREIPVLWLDLDGTVRLGKDDRRPNGEPGRWVNGPGDVAVFTLAVPLMRAWWKAGGRIVGVTNQGGVGAGIMTRDDMLAALVETNKQCEYMFDTIVWCEHKPDAGCECRKPKAGMIDIGEEKLHGLHPGEAHPRDLGVMVGDRREDQQCAKAAGLDFLWAGDWRAGVQYQWALDWMEKAAG